MPSSITPALFPGAATIPVPPSSPLLADVASALGLSPQESQKLTDRLWRFASQIRQPRKDDGTCNKTPYVNRWDTNTLTSHLTPSDPRYASRRESEDIYQWLLASLLEAHGVSSLPSAGAAHAQHILGRALRLHS